jgi:hypothetical protein
MPEARRAASALDTEPIGSTRVELPPPAEVRVDAFAERGATVSTSVFQAPHDGHWPDHLGALAAHAWQT